MCGCGFVIYIKNLRGDDEQFLGMVGTFSEKGVL